MAKPHEILGVASDASWGDIRAAYQRLAAASHPDREGGSVEEFQRVQTAYVALKAKHEQLGVFDDLFSLAQREMQQ